MFKNVSFSIDTGRICVMYCNKILLFYAGIFLIQNCFGLMENKILLLNEHTLARDENLIKKFSNFLKRIYLDTRYDYILLVKNDNPEEDCIFAEALKEIVKPIIILNSLGTPEFQQNKLSQNFLILSCTGNYLNEANIIDTPYQYVSHIIWYESDNEKEMKELCFDIQNKGYFKNILLTMDTLVLGESYYTCDYQNQLKLTRKPFMNPFLDLKGEKIITETDQLPPRTILYYDEEGVLKLSGYVGNYLTTFAERVNATLHIVPPKKMGVTSFSLHLANKTIAGLLDIAAVLFPNDMISSSSHSYPLEFMEYCYMIPLPHLRPAYHVFFDIVELKAILIIIFYSFMYGALLNIGQFSNISHLSFITILLNDKSIRGLLGQSFVMPKKPTLFMQYICFVLCYSSLLLCTTYQAYLQTHLVHPSLEKRMATYEDIRKNNYKILIYEIDARFMSPEDWKENQDIIQLVDKVDALIKLRDSMDVRFIYAVSRTRWIVFKERQKLFQRKLFYYSNQLCLNRMILLSLALRPGLPYKDLFNQHITEIRDTGLLDHWLKNNFLTLVRLKYTSFTDLSKADEYGDIMLVWDLLWIWISYGICNLIALFVFIIEVTYYKIYKT